MKLADAVADRYRTLPEAAGRVLPELCALTGWRTGRLCLPGEIEAGPSAVGGTTVHRFPVLLGDEVLGELVFVSDSEAPPAPDVAEVVLLVGRQLARVVERSRAEQRYQALARSVRDAVVTTDPSGTITAANRTAERLLGYEAADLVGRPISAVLPAMPDDARDGTPVEVQGLRSDGTRVAVQAIRTGGPAFILRERPVRAPGLRRDPLTGLAHRRRLHDRLEEVLAGNSTAAAAVVVIDIDRFKVVNDSFGARAGDALLEEVARRLLGAVRSDDTVGRVGGDEFAIVLGDLDGEGEALTLANDVRNVFAQPFAVEGRELSVSSALGVAVGRPGDVGAEQLLREAEVAGKKAKLRGHGELVMFDESMRAEVSDRLSLEHDLRSAIQRGELRVHYQPIVELESRSVVGVEALVRWEHPTRGLLRPQDFIGPAEDSGLIVPLGRWVLEEACRQGVRWQTAGEGGGVRVSVNVSARQLRQEQWADEVAQVLSESGLRPGQLVLEITESLLMEDLDTARVRLSELRELGVRIAIDDFGTGYSSLGYLRQLPVDILKVDKSFIDGVAQGPHESALARAVIKLASTLSLEAVAEGINSHRQFAQLRRLGCRFGQGYFFSPPVPADAGVLKTM